MIAVLAILSSSAAPVDQAAAARKAKNFLTNKLYAGKMMAPAALNPVLIKTEKVNEKNNQPVYYIFNTSSTYLVVAGDDRAEEILMIGDKPLDLDRIPDAMQYLLDGYKQQIVYLQEHPTVKADPTLNQAPMLRATTYGPLLTANWDQSAPYNGQCKFTYNGRSYTCVTGCPATSASMVMYFWKYPTGQVDGVESYTGSLDIGYYTSNEVSFTYPSLPATTFSWANMKDSYTGSYTTAQGNAVATLMRYVGQAEKMDYGVSGSGILTSNASNIVAMFKRFGYNPTTCRLVTKNSYSSTNWASLIQAEMASGRPVVYLGVSTSGGGHAFNVDGYDSSTNKYHVNFGWSGDGNSWYAMNAFSYSGDTFSNSQMAVIGIQPLGSTTPVLTVNPSSLTFAAATGETLTQTFTVYGTDLYDNVTISASGSYFNVSPTSITAEQAAAGATITVSYKPTAAGTHNGTITISSVGAETRIVELTGTATTNPVLHVSTNSLVLNTTQGTPVTDVFTVTGANLSGAVYLSVVNSTGGFSIDKSTLTKTIVANGATVTVTYKPTAIGNHTARVMIRSTNADTLYVDLEGYADFIKATPVMQPADEQYITSTSFRADWTDETTPDGVASYSLQYTTGDDIQSVTVTDSKNYLLENLIAGATYSYKVKARYVDNTESPWSNVQTVTLPEEQTVLLGDVNKDGRLSIADVTALINMLLTDVELTAESDVNQDGRLSIADVTALINILLTSAD